MLCLFFFPKCILMFYVMKGTILLCKPERRESIMNLISVDGVKKNKSGDSTWLFWKAVCTTYRLYMNFHPRGVNRARHFTRYSMWHPNSIQKIWTEIWTEVKKHPNGYSVEEFGYPNPKGWYPNSNRYPNITEYMYN